jgi:hypothetical protein
VTTSKKRARAIADAEHRALHVSACKPPERSKRTRPPARARRGGARNAIPHLPAKRKRLGREKSLDLPKGRLAHCDAPGRGRFGDARCEFDRAAQGCPRLRAGFDFFETQVPNPPFGLAWYQGDIQTDAHGVGVGDFIGIFSKETFIVAPGTAPAPVVFHNAPFPDANTNPKTGPVHTYHLGLWFGSPASAAHAGCANTPTPFNGTHTAGIQAMSTRNFPDLAGPLFNAP